MGSLLRSKRNQAHVAVTQTQSMQANTFSGFTFPASALSVDEAVARLFPDDDFYWASKLSPSSQGIADIHHYMSRLSSNENSVELWDHSDHDDITDMWDDESAMNSIHDNTHGNREHHLPHPAPATNPENMTCAAQAPTPTLLSANPAAHTADSVSATVETAKATSSQERDQRQQREKKRLIAWTPEEHHRFLVALETLRTDATEKLTASGQRSKGLGPGIAELIAMAVGTRSVAQVRSHAQKHFTKQRRLRGEV